MRHLSKCKNGVNKVHLAMCRNVISVRRWPILRYAEERGNHVMQKVATSLVLERALAAASVRHKLLAHNVANVDTPGYKRFDIAMQSALQQDASSPLENSIYQQLNTSLRVDGNNVDIEQEMTLVAETEAYFNAVASSLIKQMATVRYLINEGRR